MNHTLIERIQSLGLGDKFYLLRVSIGPVQEFIIEARKTRDLHIGSRLLSLATCNSMKPIFDKYGRDFIIYPYLGNSNTCPDSIPNLYMTIIPESELNSTVNQMEGSLRNFWNDVAEKVRKKIPDFADLKLWSDQMHGHFYMNWVAIPITVEELEKSYKSKVKDVQQFLDERKMTRTFAEWKGDNIEKCVQCGHRECMPDELFSKLRGNRKFKRRIKERERLCAVCLSKRLLDESDIGLNKIKFESVSDVSARPFKQLIGDNKAKKEIEYFLNEINGLREFLVEKRVDEIENLGGEWFYKEYFSYKFLKKQYGLEDTSELKNLSKKAHDALTKVYEGIGSEPCKYYTIVSMDGDDMGKLMSGSLLMNSRSTIKPISAEF